MGPSSDAAQRLERLRGYLQQDPSNVSLAVESAELALQMGRGAVALEVLDGAIARLPGEPRLLSVRGNVHLALGHGAEAALIFESLIKQNGANPVLSFNLAHARIREGRLDEALALLDSVPGGERAALPEFELSRSRTAYQLLRYDEAVASIERFLTDHPDHPAGLALKAMLLLDTDRSAEALALATSLLARGVDSWEPHLVIATVALYQQDMDTAESHFNRVLECLPDAGRAWSGLGFVAMSRRAIQRARQSFEKAVLQMPNHLGTWQGLAWACILLNDLTAAREAIDRSMQADHNFADNHGTLAVIDFMQGRKTEAELSMRKGLKLNPTSPAALYARSLFQDAAGTHVDAQATVEQIIGTISGPRGDGLLDLYRDGRKRGGVSRPPNVRTH